MECNEWRYSAGIESWSRRIEEVVPLSYTVSSKSPHPEAVGYSVLNADPPILGSILCIYLFLNLITPSFMVVTVWFRILGLADENCGIDLSENTLPVPKLKRTMNEMS